MRPVGYIIIICMMILTFGCVEDKTTGSATATEVKTSQPEAKSQKPNTLKPGVAAQPSQNATPKTRPTENIKVNMPGKDKPARTTTRNAGDEMTPEEYKALSREEKQRFREDRAFSEQNEQIKRTTPKAQAPAKAAVLPKGALPDACQLVSAEFVSEVLGIVEARDLYVKDGSGKNPGQSSSRSCFFKWEYKGNPDAGILVQVQKNPLPDEFPEWASYYISSKKNQGDKMPDGTTTYRYKDFPGMGIQGAYNYELSRYVWRTKSDNIIMIAFNIQTSSEPEQLIWAEKIGKEVTKNFNQTLPSK